MMVHNVFFWLKPEVTEAEKASFRAGLESLRAIKTVETLYIGTPAPVAARPTVDGSFTFNLTVLFKDVTAHNAYQVDPIHVAFGVKNKSLWTRVQAYDAQ